MSSLLNRISECFRIRKKHSKNNKGADREIKKELTMNDGHNVQSSLSNDDYLSLDNQFEIPIERLKLDGRLLGTGFFGSNKVGTLQMDENEENDMRVAIKRACHDFDLGYVRAIHEEIKLLTSFAPHPNILTFIGFVRLRYEEQNSFGNPAIVTELVEGGDLLSFLGSRQGIFENQIAYSDLNPRGKTEQFKNTEMSTNQRTLCTFDLISYAYQIANGMEYLASVPCNHRDLALRNVFVSQDNTIRIGDFALAGRHSNNENYKCRMANDQPLPIWWTAPEVLGEFESSEKTDVFAFGVCLFELFNLGDYERYRDAERTLPLPDPEFCSPEIYRFMLKCWDTDPVLRPTFTECVTFFAEFMDAQNIQLRQQIHGELRFVSEWQKYIRNQVTGRDFIQPLIDVPVIQYE